MSEVQIDAEGVESQLLPTTASRYAWAVVAMLWFICLLNYADRVAISSVFPILQQKYGFTKSQLGMIGAAFTWVYAIGAPLAGHIGDRYARKWIILGGLAIWSAITGLTSLCTKAWQFVLVRGAEGLGETFYFPASMAMIGDYHPPATRSRAIGIHQTSIYAGTVLGATLAGWMGQKYGWQSPFWALGIAGVVLSLVLAKFIREPARNQAERRTNGPAEPDSIPLPVFLSEFVRNRTAMLLIAAYVGANLVGFVFLIWMPTFLTEKFHLNLAMAGLGATVFVQLGSIGGAVLGGMMADRWSLRQLNGRIKVQALAALLGAPFIVLCGYTRTPYLLIISMTLFGICKGMYDSNLTAAFYDVIAPARRATATGLMNAIGWLAAGLGAVAVGVAADHHITMSVAISSTAVFYLGVAAILFYTALRTADGDIAAARRASQAGLQ